MLLLRFTVHCFVTKVSVLPGVSFALATCIGGRLDADSDL